MRTAVEAMGADPAFRQTYGFDKVVERIETQCVKPQLQTDEINHSFMTFSCWISIFIEMTRTFLPFQLGYTPARYKLHFGFRRRKVQELARINKWWARNSHVDLRGATPTYISYIIAQLRAAYN